MFLFLLLTISIFILASLMDGWRLQIVLSSPGDSLVQPNSYTATWHYDTNTHFTNTQIQTWYKYKYMSMIHIWIALQGIFWSSQTHTLSLDIMTQIHMLYKYSFLWDSFSGPPNPRNTLRHDVCQNTIQIPMWRKCQKIQLAQGTPQE